jgi:hypothetical protein
VYQGWNTPWKPSRYSARAPNILGDLLSNQTIYQPHYAGSRALVIGINDYQIASPLGYAKQDAEAFAEVLTTYHGFLREDVTVLLDQDATRQRILSEFHRFERDDISPDDRIAVFFAGHGLTRTGSRGEVGFLVPVDGNPDDNGTLIRWDNLTRNAELINAKHILFVMDACYGGLALLRSIPAGSSRFLKNMLQRYHPTSDESRCKHPAYWGNRRISPEKRPSVYRHG